MIYDINRVIQLRAGAVEANMKMWSSFGQQSGSIKAPDATKELHEDSEEHNTSKQHLASSMENTNVPTAETLQKFQVILFIYRKKRENKTNDNQLFCPDLDYDYYAQHDDFSVVCLPLSWS